MIDLNTAFGIRNRIRCLMVYIQKATYSGYNDADAGLFYSGGKYIQYLIKSNSRIILDHTDGTTTVGHERRRYEIDNHKHLWGCAPPNECLTYSNNKLWQIYYPLTVLNFSNITIGNTHDNFSGITNAQRNYEVTISPPASGGSVGASCNVYCMLNYIEIASVDPKSGAVSIQA